MDIKEAVHTLAPIADGAKMPRDAAKRVVAGTSVLAPNLGERMIAARLLGKAVVMRELAPQDLKIDIEQFSRKEAVAATAYLAFIVGKAHARQMTSDQRIDWHRTILAPSTDNLDAPPWFWRTVVDLAGSHEVGYLDHCRKFALMT